MTNEWKTTGAIFLSLVFKLVFFAHASFAQDLRTMTREQWEAYRQEIAKASADDHREMLEALGIESLRPGADGRDRSAPNAVNYDEAKVNPITELPDPLVLRNGERVASKEMWFAQRRPEIIEDFDREVYGRVPARMPAVAWKVIREVTKDTFGVSTRIRELIGVVDNSGYEAVSVNIRMVVGTPAKVEAPVPLILAFGFVPPPWFKFPPQAGPSWQQQLLEKAWGFAVIYPNTIQADNGAGLKSGIIGLVNKGRSRKPDGWGALRAWAWGASRAMDFFEKERWVDEHRVGITGHSRYGKAALVTMAYDERFAMGYISSSGEGGAKLHRRNFGELVENVAHVSEYHWMAGNFLKYAGPLTCDELPVDAHELIALCAPRPVFIGAGDHGDEWVDPRGSFLAAVHASPVYKLLGANGVSSIEYPPLNMGLLNGDIAFRRHSEGHTPAPNWPYFIAWAGRYFSDK